MGLDIYLYRYENRKETERLESEYTRRSEANWSGHVYETLSDTEKESLRSKDKEIAQLLGLGEYGEDNSRKTHIEIPSAKYPGHYFKIGYLRSSYNGGGINNVLSNLGLPTLYEMFSRDEDAEYVWQPDWQMALARVKDVAAQLREMPNLRCFDVSWNDFKDPHECTIQSAIDAMRVYGLESQKQKEFHSTGGYSNINGYFYHGEPIKVYGIVQGVRKMLFNDTKLPCAYVVCEGDNEWYIQALEITQETIEYVLSQPDKDKYFLHWSS